METKIEEEKKKQEQKRICESCKKEFEGINGTLKSWKGVLCSNCYSKRFIEFKNNDKGKKNMLRAMNKIAREVLK